MIGTGDENELRAHLVPSLHELQRQRPRRVGAWEPATPAELARHECLAFALPGHRSRWRFRRRGTDRDDDVDDVEPTGTLAISNALGLRRAALDGLGVALLADWTVDDDVAAGALVDLFPDRDASPTGFDTAAWIVYPERAYVPAKLRAFIDCLKAGA